MDWESWLKTAAKRSSDYEDANAQKTEAQIRKALDSHEPLRGRPWRVYIKGSYANNTNVRLNYDIDVAVEYYGFFYSDMCFELAGANQSVVGIVDSDDPYTRAEFKADIKAALVSSFGSAAIQTGDIAFRVREKQTTLPADVVPSWELRRYDRIVAGQPISYVGSRVFPASGGYKDNFPKIQLENGVRKNNRTGRRYKRMVRCFKKLQTHLMNEKLIKAELPSYLSECLVYNVPDTAFNHATYKADMRAALAEIFNATLPGGGSDEWHEVNDLRYLFKGKWSASEVHTVVDAAWDEMGLE